jgi:hypothetical protein
MISADQSVALWLACLVLGIAAAVVIICVHHRAKEVWTRHG